MFYNKNHYTLRIEESKGAMHFIVSFKEEDGTHREVRVSEEIYLDLENAQRHERNFARWGRRRLERLDLKDEELYERALHKPKSVEDTVLDNLRDEHLAQAIDELPEIQRRRFVLYHEFGLTYDQIAEIEGCSKVAIKLSVDRAREKVKKFFGKQA